MDVAQLNLGSTAGAAVFALLLTQILKAQLTGKYADKMPIIAWTVIGAVLATVLLKAAGYADGTYLKLGAQVLIASLLSNAGYDLLSGKSLKTFSGNTPTPPTLLLLLPVLLICAVGCEAQPRDYAFHGGIKAAWSNVSPMLHRYVEQDNTLSQSQKSDIVGPRNSLLSETQGLIDDYGRSIYGDKYKP